MMLPRWLSVAALYCLTKSMMFTPCGPRAVPTGGAGGAAPAGSCTLTTAESFFLLGGIAVGFLSVFFRGDDPPYPPVSPAARPMAKTAIVSDAHQATKGSVVPL